MCEDLDVPKIFCLSTVIIKIERFFSEELFRLPILNAEKGCMGPQYPLSTKCSIGYG